MPDISFSCANCGQELEAPEDLAGTVVQCPNCEKDIEVPSLEQAEPPASGQPAPAAKKPDVTPPPSYCPSCGEQMASGTVLCVNCGYHTKLGARISTEFQ